jgi:hypothetical protein
MVQALKRIMLMFEWLRRRPKRVNEDLTLNEVRERAEKLAHEAHLSGADEAFKLLDAGKLDGTLIEAELRAIRFLQEDRQLTTA